MADLNALSSRFERATRAAGAVRPGAAVFAELVARYAEPHRRYHTLSHIEACLAWLDWLSGVAERPQEVELALWFHDSIYELGGHENERRSAGLARERLGELGVDGQTVDRIAGHIEATKEHVAGAGDSALVVGIDLAILGARPLDFERFEREVRLEYGQVPEPGFRAGRQRVLRTLLERPAIFASSPLREELEVSARANLQRRIRQLEGT